MIGKKATVNIIEMNDEAIRVKHFFREILHNEELAVVVGLFVRVS